MENELIRFTYSGTENQRKSLFQAGMQVQKLNEDGTVPEFEELPDTKEWTESSGGGKAAWTNWRGEDWQGTCLNGGGGSTTPEEIVFPVGYAAQIWLNDAIAETIILEEVTSDG